MRTGYLGMTRIFEHLLPYTNIRGSRNLLFYQMVRAAGSGISYTGVESWYHHPLANDLMSPFLHLSNGYYFMTYILQGPSRINEVLHANILDGTSHRLKMYLT